MEIYSLKEVWGLCKNGLVVEPRKYSNGKTQEDVIIEILDAFRMTDTVLLLGGVGTGKSAIAIHVSAIMGNGKGIIVVPTKALEKQYVNDYGGGKFSVIIDGKRVNFSYIMGRNNFRCLYNKRAKASNQNLPCTVPLYTGKYKGMRRVDVAKVCPHWCPIVDDDLLDIYLDELHDVKDVLSYDSVRGKKHIIIRSKGPCPFYSQFISYARNHVILMNSSMWEKETFLRRKPRTALEVVDEGDAWLDSLTMDRVVNVKVVQRLMDEYSENEEVRKSLEELHRYIVEVLIEFDGYFGEVNETIRDLLLEYDEVMSDITGKITFAYLLSIGDVWVKVSRREGIVKVYIPDPSRTYEAIRELSARKMLLMSATFQRPEVLREVYGIRDFEIVYGETKFPGTVYLMKTGKEMPVNNKNWSDESFRREYFEYVREMVDRAKKPTLVQVHAKKYVPEEVSKRSLKDVRIVSEEFEVAWSTVARRGLDLEGDRCRSICILKFPFPDLKDEKLVAMRLRLGEERFRKYYIDLAIRELIQQVGRAVRSEEDWVEVWSPDEYVHRILPRVWRGRLVEVRA